MLDPLILAGCLAITGVIVAFISGHLVHEAIDYWRERRRQR